MTTTGWFLLGMMVGSIVFTGVMQFSRRQWRLERKALVGRMEIVRKDNEYLKKVSDTELRITCDDRRIVDDSFGLLHSLAVTRGGTTPQGDGWGTVETAYGTMKVWIRVPK